MSDNHKDGSPEDLAEVGKYVKSQVKVGLTLVVFTFVAVVGALMPFGSQKTHLLVIFGAILVNAFLVAGVSMHLKTEKRTITQFLIFTVIFTGVLFALTALAFFDSTRLH